MKIFKGFSLIELVVTLSIILLVSMMGLNYSRSLVEKNERLVMIDELKAIIHYTKMQALIGGKTVSLSPISGDNDWSKGIVLTYDKVGSEILHQWTWYHPSWQLDWSGVTSPHKIIFSNNPTKAISNGHFSLVAKHSKDRVILVLNKLGRIKML